MIRLLALLKSRRLCVTGLLGLICFQTIAELFLPALMSHIVDQGIRTGNTRYIVQVGGAMLLIALLGAAAAVGASYLSSILAMGLGKTIRSRVFQHVARFSLHEFDTLTTPSLITRTTNDITQVQTVSMIILRMMVAAPLMALGGIVMAVSEDPHLALLLVVSLPLISGIIWFIARRGMPLFMAVQKKTDMINQILREQLTGIRIIRAFNKTGYEHARFERANRDLTGTATTVNILMGSMMPVLMLIMNLTAVAVIWFGGHRVASGAIQVGALMAFVQYVFMIMFSLLMASMMFIMLPRAQASAERINAVLDTQPEIIDSPVPRILENPRGVIEFQEVTFHYPGAEEPALSRISFQARPGQVTAIIGGTGAGKSTLLHLIPRFYDVSQGCLLIDGVDVRDLSQSELRSQMALVPQQALLFTGTVAANVRYGQPSATLKDIEIAVKTAQAGDFVSEMESGFETLLAQGGKNLSGGQKQRLSIARALARKPRILLLDDAFSALDFQTDARLRNALKTESLDTTVLIVAQRVNTVLDADQIIVLEDGRIAGIGTHAELMTHSTVYREIVQSQLGGEVVS